MIQEGTAAAAPARGQVAKAARVSFGRYAAYMYPVATIGGILAIWEALSRAGYFPSYLLPAPSAVVVRFGHMSGFIVQQSLVTVEEIVLGFLLSLVVGVPLAIGLVSWRTFNQSVYPLLIGSQVVPKVAIAPLFIVWFGFGLTSRLLVAFLVAFFPIVINTVVGLKSIEDEKLYVARAAGASSWQLFWLVRLPNALPSLFAGMKVSIALAVVGAIVGEFVASDSGIGRVLLQANGNMDTALVFAGVFALIVIGVVLFVLMEALERWALPWHVSHRTQVVQSASA